VRAGRELVVGFAVLAAALGLGLGGCASGSPGPAASPAASVSSNGGRAPATTAQTVPSYYAEATPAKDNNAGVRGAPPAPGRVFPEGFGCCEGFSTLQRR
jgi:hypothetical protein